MRRRKARRNIKEQYEDSSSSVSSSRISTGSMRLILEKLKGFKNRKTTNNNYLRIWRNFNIFLMRLDCMPREWEDRTSLYIAHLIDQGIKSATVKSYISAIKTTLVNDNYKWDDSKVLLNTLTRACRVINNVVMTRLPIHCSLLELMLFEIERVFANNNQLYLEHLYKAIFSLGYYGLMRVGELTVNEGGHTVKAKDVHLATNKEKLLVILYTSKTHGVNS